MSALLLAHGEAGDLEDALLGLGIAAFVLVIIPWLAYRVMGESRGEYFLRTLKGELSGGDSEGFKPGWRTNYDKPGEVADAPPEVHGRPMQARQRSETAAPPPAAAPPTPRPEARYWLSRTWTHEGLLNARAWLEPTQFELKDEGGRVVYRMVASSAWSERRMSFQDPDGRCLASLHKTWKRRSYKLLRGNRLEWKITYKDPVWRWRDRYVVRAADGREMVAVQAGVGSGVYEFREDGRTLGRYSERGTLEVCQGADPLLLAATALSIDLGPGES